MSMGHWRVEKRSTLHCDARVKSVYFYFISVCYCVNLLKRDTLTCSREKERERERWDDMWKNGESLFMTQLMRL